MVSVAEKARRERVRCATRGRTSRDCHQALAVTRQRCWEKSWAVDLDILAFFDSVPHSLLLKAVAHHTGDRWVLLYIERWLKAPTQMPDGTLAPREKGTPPRRQGLKRWSLMLAWRTSPAQSWSQAPLSGQ